MANPLELVMDQDYTLTAVFRSGQEMPIGPDTDVRFGDVLRVTGPDAAIQRLGEAVGGPLTGSVSRQPASAAGPTAQVAGVR